MAGIRNPTVGNPKSESRNPKQARIPKYDRGKSEIRISKSETNSNIEIQNGPWRRVGQAKEKWREGLGFRILGFGFVLDFEIRISDLESQIPDFGIRISSDFRITDSQAREETRTE